MRYELVKGQSSKFWEIRLEGKGFSVTWGRIGTDGRSLKKMFPTPEAARAMHDKLVREKLREGYIAAGPVAKPAPVSDSAEAAREASREAGGIRERFIAIVATLESHPKIQVGDKEIAGPASPEDIAAADKASSGKMLPALAALAAEMNGCRISWRYKGTEIEPGDRPRVTGGPPDPELGGRIIIHSLAQYATTTIGEPGEPVLSKVKTLARDRPNFACLYLDPADNDRIYYLDETPGTEILATGLTLDRFVDLMLRTRGVRDWLRLFCADREGDSRGAKAKELIAKLFPDVDVSELKPFTDEPRVFPPPGHRRPKEWTDLVGAAMERGDFQQALEHSNAAIKQDPTAPAYWHNRGAAQFSLGRLADAEASFREALRLEPSFTAQMSLATLLEQQGRHDEHESLLKSFVYHSPDRPLLLVLLAKAAAKRGDRARVLEALGEALHRDPSLWASVKKEFADLWKEVDFEAFLADLPPQNPFAWFLPSQYTTRPAPVDIGKRYPELVPKTTVRLHPRARGVLPVGVSKMGGRILANGAGGWPTCKEHGSAYTAVLQILAADAPEGFFPEGRDLFQLLWCPHDHESCEYAPAIAPRWLDSKTCPAPAPENPVVADQESHYVPTECALFPERLADFIDGQELESIGLASRMKKDEALLRLETKIDSASTEPDGAFAYRTVLGAAAGSKLGGYPHWVQSPDYPPCPQCKKTMEHYLTIASMEWDGENFRRWKPLEEGNPDRASGDHIEDAGLMIGDAGSLYMYVCRKHQDWTVAQRLQSS